jgi:molybdopterin synthase sulfur carrier subunit
MAVTVRIPTPLQRLTNNQAEVRVEGSTVRELLTAMEAQFPGIQERLCDESGRLRRFVNVYVADEDIRFQQNEETPVPEGAEVSIIPAIAGG